jgi:hypothetical protein
MADISDVEQALVSNISAILYPGGTVQSSIIGMPCRVYRGWPNSATLNSDLGSGVVNVTIVTDNDSGRTTTRYLSEWRATPSTPGTTISVTGQSITVGGTPGTGDVVGALINGQAYAYRILPGDTSMQVAANLSQAIQANLAVALQGATITVLDAGVIVVRAVSDSAAHAETRRQEKDVRIICWCPSPIARDAVAAAIDQQIDLMPFMSLPDSSDARLVYKNTNSYDQAQNALLYRRDLIYIAEYPTISVMQQPSMLFGDAVFNGSSTFG